jgi:hypothetical protein
MCETKLNSLPSKSWLIRISVEHQCRDGVCLERVREKQSRLWQLAFRHDQGLSCSNRELFHHLLEAFLVRGLNCYKFDSNTLRSGPSNRSLADMDWGGVCFNLEKQFNLHAGERAKGTFQPAPFERKVFHHGVVSQFIPLYQRAGS